MTTQEVAPAQGEAALTLVGMSAGAWSTRVLQVGTELGIADVLKDGPKTLAEIAEATDTHGPSLGRLMRALVAMGIFAEVAPGTYGMTDLAWPLCRDHPGSVRNFILFFGFDWAWSLWSELTYAVKTGQSAMKHVHGKNIWQYIDAHPEDLHVFNTGMSEFSNLINPSIIDAYDFSAFQSLVDVGGGLGHFLQLLAERNPSFQAILVDRPSVMEEAKAIYDQSPLGPQFTLVGGDFLTEVPAGADAYLYKFIANDWNDDYVRQFLAACRRAIPAHGKLLITEFLLTENPDLMSVLMDIMTFLGFEGGHGRTEAEFQALLNEAGFKITQIIPTMTGLHIIEAVPC